MWGKKRKFVDILLSCYHFRLALWLELHRNQKDKTLWRPFRHLLLKMNYVSHIHVFTKLYVANLKSQWYSWWVIVVLHTQTHTYTSTVQIKRETYITDSQQTVHAEIFGLLCLLSSSVYREIATQKRQTCSQNQTTPSQSCVLLWHLAATLLRVSVIKKAL